MDCIFCKIIAGEIPCYLVYEDAEVLAFLDIRPKTVGHTLVIPKTHYENIYDTPPQLLCAMMQSAQKIASAIHTVFAADGINVSMNNGVAAGQIIFHAHLHVIARFVSEHTSPTEELESVAAKIKKALL